MFYRFFILVILLEPEFMIHGHSVKVIFPLIVESGNRIAILIVDMRSLFFRWWQIFMELFWLCSMVLVVVKVGFEMGVIRLSR